MAEYGSAYNLADVDKSFLDNILETRQGESSSIRSTFSQKKKLQEQFEAELEAAQAKAKKDAKKGSGLFKALNLVGMGLGPLGAGLTAGISAGLQGNQQRKAMEGLLSGVSGDRWKKTFLKNPMKAYEQEAQDTQMSSGDVLRGAFGSGLTAFMTSKMLGGDKETGGVFKKMGEAKKASKLMPSIQEKVIKQYGKGGVGEGMNAIKLGSGKTPSTLLMEDILHKKGFGNVNLSVAASKNPALKQLMESFKLFSKGDGLSGGTEELKSAMMWPMLLQQLLGD